jgi:hypothetical protein
MKIKGLADCCERFLAEEAIQCCDPGIEGQGNMLLLLVKRQFIALQSKI